ncbi:MAG: hypothetical protein IJ939_02055 [Clostridia bacterium]|nr:hypothetical protein [Clostridia bacterium]
MKKLFIILLSAVALMIFTGCRTNEEAVGENVILPDFTKEELDEKFGTDEIYIVKTYMETPANEFQEYFDNNLIFTKVKHYQLSDGSWKTDEHGYKYKLEVSGVMNNAACGSTYYILSNSDDITFDMAWKAAGYSSNSEDYFKPEDAIIVALSKFDIDSK